MKRAFGRVGPWALGVTVLAMLSACAHKVLVMVPPNVDLTPYGTIGLIDLACSDARLQPMVTAQLQQAILEAQPGVRVLELGSEHRVLESVQHDVLDPEAVRAVAALHNVDALLTGRLELSRIAPRFSVSTSLTNVSASAEIQASMTARLVEADRGATVWATSARDRVTVAHTRVSSHGVGDFGLSDPEATYATLVHRLATRVTGDFRTHYVKKRPEDVPPGYQLTYPAGVEVYVPPALTSAEE